jgi:hypothetical protein
VDTVCKPHISGDRAIDKNEIAFCRIELGDSNNYWVVPEPHHNFQPHHQDVDSDTDGRGLVKAKLGPHNKIGQDLSMAYSYATRRPSITAMREGKIQPRLELSRLILSSSASDQPEGNLLNAHGARTQAQFPPPTSPQNQPPFLSFSGFVEPDSTLSSAPILLPISPLSRSPALELITADSESSFEMTATPFFEMESNLDISSLADECGPSTQHLVESSFASDELVEAFAPDTPPYSLDGNCPHMQLPTDTELSSTSSVSPQGVHSETESTPHSADADSPARSVSSSVDQKSGDEKLELPLSDQPQGPLLYCFGYAVNYH